MLREIRLTADGSSTLFVPSLNEHYHSTHGALQESVHVFIKNGLLQITTPALTILEIGFGTGLNALLTAIQSKKTNQKIEYTSVEKYPLSADEILVLNYSELLSEENAGKLFSDIHKVPFEEKVAITPNFTLQKIEKDFLNIDSQKAFDLIYFDAFAPEKQPKLWTETMFSKMFAALKPGGFLVTYCAKGQVKRNMKSVGFKVEALPGPPGKREMTKALRPI